ncbi:DUF3592 domain-containing protein [Ruminococcus sp.]|jgi:flagellar basal body-associated protein FliL|uniref:DUF3592 domain-containing protein n=1 Tax=Ruminococcus sp. TaxID=41978 RepID=UPI0025FB3842|nr:DUF3592 domain-containing protein [Ruminococcus sp.]
MNNNEQQTENNSTKNRALRIGIIFAVILTLLGFITGLAFTVVKKAISGAVTQDTSAYNVSVTAVISENREHLSNSDDSSSMVYTPVYEYEYNGKTYNVEGSVSSSNKKYEVGEKVDIRISEGEPGKMYDPAYNRNTVFKEIDREFSGFWLLVIFIPCIIIILTVVVVCVVMRSKAAGNGSDNTDTNDDFMG